MKREEWHDVVGYEGRYVISNYGRVKSLPNAKYKTERLLRQSVSSDGYYVVNLSSRVGGRLRQRVFKVHWLVASAFIGPYKSGLHTCHNDGNKLNNYEKNLRYDTAAGNASDRKIHGQDNRGSKNGMACLCEKQVIDIKRRLASGEGVCAIARDYEISHGAVSAIKNNKRWAHVRI